MAGMLEVIWDSGGALTVRGAGFKPHERVSLTTTIRSGGTTVVRGPGTVIAQSGGSSTQSSTITLSADAQGTFQQRSTAISSQGAEVVVSATGSQGTRTEARTTIAQTRP